MGEEDSPIAAKEPINLHREGYRACEVTEFKLPITRWQHFFIRATKMTLLAHTVADYGISRPDLQALSQTHNAFGINIQGTQLHEGLQEQTTH